MSRKARGAQSNRTGRFEAFERVAFDDGWGPADEAPEPVVTQVRSEATRHIITHNDSPDVPFERSINPYKGCEHGCIYCFARPTHAYLGLSPGLDFESRIIAKPEGPVRLRQELSRPGYQCRVIALGANTDPYQPVERQLRITRGLLEVLRDFHHPVSVVTKSNGVLRDLDILAPLAEQHLASVMVSVTSLDRSLARRMEPRAPSPSRRLQAIEKLAAAGVPVGVLASPIIPGLNDDQLERILEAARAAGARYAGYILLRLPREIKDLFSEWLAQHYPDRLEHVLALIRASRGGRLNNAQFGERMRGSGRYADLLAQRFALAHRRLSFDNTVMDLDTTQFQRPPAPGDQLGLFDARRR